MALELHEPRMPQTIEVEGQGVRRNPEFCCNLARRHTLRSRLNQQAIRIQPALLCKRRKCGHDLIFIHVSTIIEVMYPCQPDYAKVTRWSTCPEDVRHAPDRPRTRYRDVHRPGRQPAPARRRSCSDAPVSDTALASQRDRSRADGERLRDWLHAGCSGADNAYRSHGRADHLDDRLGTEWIGHVIFR